LLALGLAGEHGALAPLCREPAVVLVARARAALMSSLAVYCLRMSPNFLTPARGPVNSAP
jgi:hypothetical protein